MARDPQFEFLIDPLKSFLRLLVSVNFALELLGRDSTPCLAEKKDRVEPQTKRRCGLLKDRSRCWVDVVTAGVARVGLARLDAVKAA